MTSVPAVIGSEIVVRVNDLPPMACEQIKSALTFENEERKKNEALKIWGWWDLPKVFSMYREETRRNGDHVLCLPRGFAEQFVGGMVGMGATVAWDDQRSRAPSTPGYFVPFILRDYQASAIADMLRREQGFYRCPAGGGKSITMFGLMAYAQQRTIVITDKAGLLEQWRSKAAEQRFLGLSLDYNDERSVGKIGEDVWEERDLTICLRQTLFSRLWELKATDWFRSIGLVIVDEGHHMTADTLQEILRACPSALFFGTSATPFRTSTHGQIIKALVGPIVADTPRQILYDRGVLMRPSLRVVRTDLEATHWRTHDSDQDGNCDVPNCRKKGTQHSHRDNYQSVQKKLVEDKKRAALIAQQVVSERGHVHLIASRQLKHLDLMKRAVLAAGWDGPTYMLRGEENALGDSQRIAEAIIAGGFWEVDEEESKKTKTRVWRQISPASDGIREAIIFSTVADEGLDIPPIDRVHFCFPIRSEVPTIQLAGRCERVAEGKHDAVVVNYNDWKVTIFNEQNHDRMQTFRMQGIVEKREEIAV